LVVFNLHYRLLHVKFIIAIPLFSSHKDTLEPTQRFNLAKCAWFSYLGALLLRREKNVGLAFIPTHVSFTNTILVYFLPSRDLELQDPFVCKY